MSSPLAFKFVNEFGGLDVPEVERPLLTAQQDLGKCVLNQDPVCIYLIARFSQQRSRHNDRKIK